MSETPACDGLNDDTMFPEYTERGTKTAEEVERHNIDVQFAKAFCHVCPQAIKTSCLAGALVRDEEFGIWGGLDRTERVALVSKLKDLAGIGTQVAA